MIFSLCSAVMASIDPIDFTALDFYARKGFDTAWVTVIPSSSDLKNWEKIPGRKGNRPIRVVDIFKGIQQKGLINSSPKPLEFTFVCDFNLNSGYLVGKSLALYFPQIGENWEIFFNGYSLKSEVYYGDDGYLKHLRAVRNEIIEIPFKYIREGRNVLGIRIIGNPENDRTGLFMRDGYKIDYYEKILNENKENWDYMLFGVYLFFGLYHLMLYIRRRKESFNLSFGIATIFAGIYYVCRSGFIFNMIADTFIIKSVELVSMVLLVIFMIIFFERIIYRKVSLPSKIYIMISVLLAVLIIPFEKFVLLIWQLSLPLPIVYVVGYDILLPLYGKFRQNYSEMTDCSPVTGVIFAGLKSISLSVPGNLLIGTLIWSLSAMADIYMTKSGIPSSFSKYGFFIMNIGIVVMLANRFLNVHNKMEELNVTLENKVNERTRELVDKNDEIQAANEEMEAMNATLSQANIELLDAKRAADRDMEMAAQVQSSFFPKGAPKNAQWDIAYEFKPLSGVSGDVYDFYMHDDELIGMSLMDVSGHGIASGLITLLARSVLTKRFIDSPSMSLNKLVEKINHDLIIEIGNVDYYLTGILLKFSGTKIEYINAGHTDLLYRSSKLGKVKEVIPKSREFKGHFLGVEAMESAFSMLSFSVDKEDMLLLYTDCLIESQNYKNEEFGVERLKLALQNIPENSSSEQALNYVLKNFYTFVGSRGVTDDLTAILIRKI